MDWLAPGFITRPFVNTVPTLYTPTVFVVAHNALDAEAFVMELALFIVPAADPATKTQYRTK